MSLLTRNAFRLGYASLRTSTQSIRPFHASAVRAALSESDHSLDDDVRKKAIDEHKDDQLAKQKEGKGHWKGELSSNSEVAIKADRQEIHNAEHDIENLQKQTSGAMEQNHEHGKKR